MQIFDRKDGEFSLENYRTNESSTDIILKKKHQYSLQEIAKIEQGCFWWIQSRSTQLNYVQKIQTTDKISKTKEAEQILLLNNIKNEIQFYFNQLRVLIVEQDMIKLLTNVQLTTFFEEINSQLLNKIKLFEDIKKLQLFSTCPDCPKKTYSLKSNMILKKWLMQHYQHPYPNEIETSRLMELTGLTKKQILNWFINARNSLKKFRQKEQKFTKTVLERYKSIQKVKYPSQNQILHHQNNLIQC